MPKIKINDINIHYEVHGAGEPLLLIHGLGARGESFAHQLPALAPHFLTIIFDNRGVGETDQPRGPYSIPQMADDAAGLLDAMGIERARIFGVSMGGMIAQELVLRHPQRVVKLALGCTHSGIRHCTPSPAWVTELFRTAAGKSREQVVRDFIPVNFAAKTREHDRALIETVVARMISNRQEPYAYFQQLDAVYRFDSYDRLPEIRQPALVLTGTEDPLIPPANSDVLAARIPNARLIRFEDASHLFFIEKADEVNRELLEFFSG
ncbi:MAG TPA: alpha/beta hydrolase [Blastocatellia bacterium]|nr:alpha/beta hydrolase [Blastocatellia bacterium]